MKVYGIVVGYVKNQRVYLLCSAYDTSTVGIFEKGSVKESCNFLTRTLLPRLEAGKRQGIEHDNFVAFCRRWTDGLGVLMLTGDDYPDRVAYTCLHEVYKDFLKAYPLEWQDVDSDNQLEFTKPLKEFIDKYKNPEEFDKLLSAQLKVDQTQEVVRLNVEKLLKNGEALETLIAQSNDLSDKSKVFYKNSKKLKFKCCSIQ